MKHATVVSSSQQASYAWLLSCLEAMAKATGCGCVVAHSLAGRRHEWVYGDSLVLNYVQGAALAGSGNDSLAVSKLLG